MPLYTYACAGEHTMDLIRKVDERHEPVVCEECGKTMTLEVQTSVFDPRMGLDPSFPSAYDKWAKTRTKAGKGR